MMMTAPMRVIAILVGSALYLGLAVLGWGGFAAFFVHPALAALAVAFSLLAIVSCFAGGNISRGVREDRGNRWVLVPFGIVGLALGYLPAWSDRAGVLILDGDGVRWLGVLLYAAGGALRLWPVFVLGNRFSGLVAIQPGHTLVTHGIYRAIRNPSYLGLLVNALGWSLAFRSGAGVLLTLLFIPPLIARMRAEERLLRSQFGEAYEAYRSRTARLIPGVY
jgi:protein-S-isoprenylcysteine O-methyltransferase Ste14